jgi:dihydroflavonol-4-reductase
VASPFPAGVPAHEDQLIRPAREGALRVLRAARDAARRVVLTSSFAAIGYGHRLDGPRTFSEEDWSDVHGQLSAYAKSKTLAERAAWEFVRDNGASLELAVINPTPVFGPVLGADYSTSIQLIAVSGDFVTVQERALTLRKRMGAAATRVPTRVLPNWLVRLASLRDPALKQLVPELGKMRNAAHDKAIRLLGWAPRPSADAIVATGNGLVELGLLKHSR